MRTVVIKRRDFVKNVLTGTVLLTATSFPRVACSKEKMEVDSLLKLLQELIFARGPVGQEDEVRVICERELKKLCDKTWIDSAGNVIGLIEGRGNEDAPVIRVIAHMDENALMVKRVNSDGTLRVKNLGGIYPYNIGQGQMEILSDSGIIPGILSVGPMHTSSESGRISNVKAGKMDWENVYIFTRKTAIELDKLGVHPGTRIVIARERRKLFDIGDCVGGYFMDDRACVAITLGGIILLKESGKKPANDIYVVMSTQEEIGAFGAAYAASHLPGEITLAIDVGPAAAEYNTVLSAEPIIAYGDSVAPYSKSVADRLRDLAKDLGMKPQTASWESYGSDASIANRYGHTALSGLLCIATENTHGYEIIPKEGLVTCSRLLAAYMEKPVQ